MFFQRIFERKDISDKSAKADYSYIHDNENAQYDINAQNVSTTENCKDNNKDNNNNQPNITEDPLVSIYINNNKMQRRTEAPIGAVQLTPLWEHILRTRRLPETICPASMYAEFHERLQDAEWQVRQHALRVLVDILVVMQAKADRHNSHFLVDLIKNLGHPAPTVRKGALDCLRVYLSETAIPEMVMLQILDIGLGQQSVNIERLTCGVLLSLPALLQSILHTPQRHFIIRHIMERLLRQLQQQQAQQELSLKVLSKIRDLLGVQEFESYLVRDGDDSLSLYKHMCKVYGISNDTCRVESTTSNNYAGAWRAIPREHTWQNTTIAQAPGRSAIPEKRKVIMETEIKINEDTLTMRILEAETETEETDSPIIDRSELVCRSLSSAQSQQEIDTGILQIISDSEIEDLPAISFQNESELSTPFRRLRRVTFGGEVVKMRTPDSDAASAANYNDGARSKSDQNIHNPNILTPDSTLPPPVLHEQFKAQNNSDTGSDQQMRELTLEILSDNTKPLARAPDINKSNVGTSPKRDVSHSPMYRSHSISPIGSNTISPRVPHKEIEVLHNLQRDPDPSPRSLRRPECGATDPVNPTSTATCMKSSETTATINSWEDLDIVNYQTLMDLRSGSNSTLSKPLYDVNPEQDWRKRTRGMAELQKALSSSTNLVLVQPYLDSLLRTLLSSERNGEVAELKRQLLVNLVTRLPLDNLEKRTQQILCGLCRQGNSGANRVCQALMQRLPAGTIVAKLTAPEYLHAKSSKFRDHALQMSIYSLMSFPGTCFDVNILTVQVTYAALNRKRRVRQAALEVFAVLANVSSVDQVLNIVAEVTTGVESGPALLAAVKMRISRLQLPIITTDGAVSYVFHKTDKPGSIRFGEDMDWIMQGEGSASPNAIKKRRMHVANKKLTFQESIDTENSTGINDSYHTDDNLHRHYFHSSPEALGISRTSNDLSQRKSYGTSVIQANFMDRRLFNKASSESSMDGRSTDSTATTCSSSSGSSSFIQLTPCDVGINKRLIRQNSRFPVVQQRTDLINNFMHNMYENSTAHNLEEAKKTKENSVVQKVQKQQAPKKVLSSQDLLSQQTMDGLSQAHTNESRNQEFNNQLEIPSALSRDFDKAPISNCGDPATLLHQICTLFDTVKQYVLEKTMATRQRARHYDSLRCRSCCREKSQRKKSMQIDKSANVSNRMTCLPVHPPQSLDKSLVVRSFSPIEMVNVEDNKPTTPTVLQPVSATSELTKYNRDGSPLSLKSTNYSQKSTASVKLSNIHSEVEKLPGNHQFDRNGMDSRILDQPQFGDLVVDDVENEIELSSPEPILRRNESVSSLHSKTESIKTQLEDATPQLSRAQSIKSLAIEEEIESSNSFVVVEEIQHQLESITLEPVKVLTEVIVSDDMSQTSASQVLSNKKNTTIPNEKTMHSRSISLDSIYSGPHSKQGSLDTIITTTDNSSHTEFQLARCANLLPARVQRTPLKQKSKTSYFLRSQRRISPVKQAIQMPRTELFPSNMSRFDKPREALIKTFDQLDSSNWENNMTGLKCMVRLIRYHSDFLDSHMHMTCIQLTRSVRNLRSQVARAACQAGTELFTLKCKSLELECDDLVCAFLHRTADTNRFLRADAMRALESMVDHLQPPKVLNILTAKGAQHQNALVRTTTAKLLFRLVERLGSDRVYTMGRENRDKVFVVGANLLLEGSLETRNYAKSLFRALSEHASFQRIILEIIPPRIYRNVEKTLRTIMH